MSLEDQRKLAVFDAAARLAAAEWGELLAWYFDEARGIFPQQLHWIDCIVKRRGDVAENPCNRLVGIALLSLLMDETVDDGGSEGGEAVLTERGLYVQADVLLAKLQCVVARGKACTLIPDIEIVREANACVVLLRTAADICVVRLDSCHACILLRGISAGFLAAAFAVDLRLLEVVRPRRSALLHADMIERVI